MNWKLMGTAGLALVAALWLADWTYETAFVSEFTCRSIIEDRLDGARQICAGFDPLPSGIRSAAEVFITVPDTKVDGLAPVVDPPLGTARSVTVGVGLILLAGLSAIAVYVYNRVEHVAKLLSFDPQAWSVLARSTRAFSLVFLVMLGGVRLLVF